MNRTVLVALCCFMAGPCLGWKQPIRFTRITTDHGLSQNSAHAVVQDQDGFLWIGTQDGLNRYDGYEIVVFRHDQDNPAGLSRSGVFSLYADPSGIIWAGTRGGGLNRYDGSAFTAIHHRPGDSESLASGTINVIIRDGNFLWVGAEGGLSRMNLETGKIQTFVHGSSDPNSLGDNDVRAILSDGSGGLWVGTQGGGLSYYHRSRSGFVNYRHEESKPHSLSHNHVRALHRDAQNLYWVGTGNGLNRFDPSSGQFRNIPVTEDGHAVYALWEDVNNPDTLWVGTWGAGLVRFGKRDESITRFPHVANNTFSVSSNNIRSLFQDRGGTLWIGTGGGGVNRFDRFSASFDHYLNDPSRPGSLNDNFVFSLYEDTEGVLWVGTRGSGLERFDRQTGRFDAFGHDPQDPNSISNNHVRVVTGDRNGNLWIGTDRGGVNRFRDGRFQRFLHDGENPDSLSHDRIRAIAPDADGTIWIGTLGGGVERYEPHTGRFIHHRHNPDDPESLGDDYVRSLHMGLEDNLWIGTDSGLSCYDRATRSFIRYRHQEGKTNSLSHNMVLSLYQDQTGGVWVGTAEGLNHLDPATGIIRSWLIQDGFPSDFIYCILQDRKGLLWVSTNKGLSSFDPAKEVFRNFGVRDGIQSQEFNSGAGFYTSSGLMYFGGINGFNEFRPEDIHTSTYVPPVVLTRATIDGQTLPLPVSSLSLEHQQNMLSFSFAALDFADPKNNQYAYQLEGFNNNEWIRTDKSRMAVFMNLPAGSYYFRVKGSNRDGLWNEEGIALPIRVKPAPWRSIWAYVLYGTVLLVLIAIYLMTQARIKRKLEERVAIRTRQLQYKNQQLDNRNRVLETLDQIVKVINREVELEAVAGSLLDQAIALVADAERGFFLILEPDSDHYRLLSIRGYDGVAPGVSISRKDYLERRNMREAQVSHTGEGIFRAGHLIDGSRFLGLENPKSLISMPISFRDETLAAVMVLTNFRNPKAFDDGDHQTLARLREHAVSAMGKAKILRELLETQKKLLATAHEAGMAEVVTGVLHNLGNVLNSVHTSLHLIEDRLDEEKWISLLERAANMLSAEEPALDSKRLGEILGRASVSLRRRSEGTRREFERLVSHVEKMASVLRQQHKDTQPGSNLLEPMGLNDLIRKCRDSSEVVKQVPDLNIEIDFRAAPLVLVSPFKFQRIFTHLIRNSVEAMDEPREGRITISTRQLGRDAVVTFTDNGRGLEAGRAEQVVFDGYTTKKGRQGYGLHYCANAMGEMLGSLSIESPGPGRGATVRLVFPLADAAPPEVG